MCDVVRKPQLSFGVQNVPAEPSPNTMTTPPEYVEPPGFAEKTTFNGFVPYEGVAESVFETVPLPTVTVAVASVLDCVLFRRDAVNEPFVL